MTRRPTSRPGQMELPVMVAISSPPGPKESPKPAAQTDLANVCPEATPQDRSIYAAISAKYLAALKR
jgi:hypothetical protein